VAGVETPRAVLPQSAILFQNYPNPFNPSTIIRFSLPVRSNVNLKVYNLIGEEEVSLVHGIRDAGEYQAVCRGLVATGIYWYRLETTDLNNPQHKFVDSKKMLYIK
jgi:hypothetical protein